MNYNEEFFEVEVAILILLELTLQYYEAETPQNADSGRNPYFIGINSAILE